MTWMVRDLIDDHNGQPAPDQLIGYVSALGCLPVVVACFQAGARYGGSVCLCAVYFAPSDRQMHISRHSELTIREDQLRLLHESGALRIGGAFVHLFEEDVALEIITSRATHKGPRDDNQDRSLVLPGLHLYAVADGLGGHPRGAEAAQVAVDTLAERFVPTGGGALVAAVRAADAAVDSLWTGPEEDRYAVHRPATTLTAAWIQVDGPRVTIVHVGDSRAYLLRNGILGPLTCDHLDIESRLARALGSIPLPAYPPDVIDLPLLPGDLLLLCTDGLFQALGPAEISAACRSGPPEQLAALLVDLAYPRLKDNVTVVVVALLSPLARQTGYGPAGHPLSDGGRG